MQIICSNGHCATGKWRCWLKPALDGTATGATTRAALLAVCAALPRKIVLAVPVAATQTLEELRSEADDIVCPEQQDALGAVGYFCKDFAQVSDAQVIAVLAAAPR